MRHFNQWKEMSTFLLRPTEHCTCPVNRKATSPPRAGDPRQSLTHPEQQMLPELWSETDCFFLGEVNPFPGMSALKSHVLLGLLS